MELKEILTLPHGLCSVCVKRSYCDMVEDMKYDGWDMVYKEECQWFKQSVLKEVPYGHKTWRSKQ